MNGEDTSQPRAHCDDAKELFARAKPLLQEATRNTRLGPDAEVRDLLLAEYAHAADSLLRNEEDGERRVRFFLSLAGASGGVVVLIRGDQAMLTRPDVFDPVLVALAILLAMIGYVTFIRVIERNIASERYRRGLDRIRRAFLSSPQDHRVTQLAFSPYGTGQRCLPSWRSVGRGGWLETVAMVEAVLLGAVAALLVPWSWWLDALLGAGVAIGAWVGLIARARHRYAAEKSKPAEQTGSCSRPRARGRRRVVGEVDDLRTGR